MRVARTICRRPDWTLVATTADCRRHVLRSAAVSMHKWFGTSLLAALVAVAVASCGGDLQTSLERLLEARRLSSELFVQFTKTVDAGNRAVMANTEEASRAFASDAEAATQAVQRDVDALGPILMSLGYSAEASLLDQFRSGLAEYRTLDQTILGLAVENTNLKAQRLSFGSAQQAATAFKDALDAVVKRAGKEPWRVQALAATALAAVREIQVLQAPHIAEADDASMTHIEAQMMTAEAAARQALEMLVGLVPSESRPRLSAATAALDQFMGVNGNIVRLSRRNSNVRSLALSLGQKRMLAAACEEAIRALQDALNKRDFGGRR